MKDLFRMLVIGLAAGACISARPAPDNEEIAMARCSSDDRCYPEQGRRYENNRRRSERADKRRYEHSDKRRDNDDRRYYEDERGRRQYYDGKRAECSSSGCGKGYSNDDREGRDCYSGCEKRGCNPSCVRGYSDDDRERGRCYSIDESGRKRCNRPDNRGYDVEKQRNCDEHGRCQEMTDRSDAVELRNNYKKIRPTSAAVIVRKSAAQKILEGN